MTSSVTDHAKDQSELNKDIADGTADAGQAETLCGRYELLFTQSRDIILFVRFDDGRILDANEAAVRTYGFSRSELLSMSVTDLRTEADKDKVRFQMLAALNGRIIFETVHRCKDGRLLPMEISSTGAVIEGVCTLISIIRDQSEHKRIEQELKQAKAEKELILNATSEHISLYSCDLRIQWVNNSLARFRSQQADELIGRYCYEVWHDRTSPCDACPVVKARLTGKPEQGEKMTPDGCTWLVRGYPVLNADGKVENLIEFTIDISDRKASERRIEQINESLERRIAERTSELASRTNELRELANKTIQAMECDRKALSKELHDSIGGTLGALMYMVQGRLEGMKDGAPQGCIPFERISSHLQAAIAEVRNISSQLRPSVLDDFGLTAAIKDAVRNFNEFYPHVAVSCQVALKEQSIPDDARTVIYRVLQEALNNVGKHSKADRADIRCKRYRGSVHLNVRDNGIGFDIRQVFNVSNGFGLHSMKERVEICKGRLRIKSAPGKGTEIMASIPLELVS